MGRVVGWLVGCLESASDFGVELRVEEVVVWVGKAERSAEEGFGGGSISRITR